MALRRMSAWSALSGKPDPGVDGILFKRVFSDLERLLDETLSLALDVADHSETAAHASHPAVSNEYGTDHVDVSNLSMGNRPQENVIAFPIDGVYTAYLARPGCRRAATYTAVPKRPRLADIVESYSGTYQELRAKTQAERRQQSGPSRRSSLSRKSRKSNQGLKADRRRRPVMLKDLRSTSALLDVGGMDAQGQTTTHKRSAAVNVSSAVRSGTSHDALPEHNIAGRRLHGEHGINLRKRSHATDCEGLVTRSQAICSLYCLLEHSTHRGATWYLYRPSPINSNVLIIPRSKSEEMERITQARRRSSKRRASMPNDLRALMEEDYAWRPTMIGNPMGKSRRMNVLEMGNLTRWQDIRRRNKLIDAGVHLNRDTLDQGLDALDVALENHIDNMRQNASGFFRRGSLRKHGGRLRHSNQSSEQTFHDLELDMLDPVGTPSESSQQPRHYVERECVMGQTIKEENKDEAQAGPSTSQKDHT
ncbi:hypothetical protein FOXG_05314 [Fusarium oxysporum f. sp. lycopersici 4287]|uniref:Uncharacterized protein n=1 Tax=Fusarium oxysporum f. sp. lycopersici (strain 4287 / CBS 123668 / FGSC 9935 / NRRL 34936) TaxID=426428 RepID=A0A0J9UVC7_FUSO4|nr:hypothetical protein FOXG_05314 [Fusarium oxysporum f. sp. lycopersici 4287]KNB02436.1 hypothetical protein FOXG_05314 [Fusarium oxysporum f. sp. lycopersici 4287]